MPDESDSGETPGQGAVAVSLAAKRKTDGYGFYVANRKRNMLDLLLKLVIRQAAAGQGIAQRLTR
jgi:hypothetical protein